MIWKSRCVKRPRDGTMRRRGRHPALLASLVIVVAATPVAAQEFTWIDAGGDPVSFASREQAAAFLRTADVVSVETLPVGVTAPRKALLEQDGVRINAIFRDVDNVNTRVRLDDGSFHARLRDSALFEVAAYRMAILLGIDSVPPAVQRTIAGRSGSVQLWVENAMSGSDRREDNVTPGDYRRWIEQYRRLETFDLIIGNVDRNSGNYLVDESGKLWFIDHTRSFQTFLRDWSPRRIAVVDRELWENLRGLERNTLEETLGDLLDRAELNQLWQRVEDVVDHVREQIDLRGEDQVILNLVRG